MPAKKHNLTKGKDDILGGSGTDLFLAPLKNGQKTLNDADRLNGGGGTDRLVATINETTVQPHAKNVEIGDFTFETFTGTTLNLASAQAMTSLVLRHAPDLFVKNAGQLSSLNCIAMQDDIGVRLEGLDTQQVKRFSVSVKQTTGLEIFADSLNPGAALGRVDLYVSNSDLILHPMADARKVVIHSSGSDQNFVTFSDFAANEVIRSLVITGAAAVTFDCAHGFKALSSIDASSATGTVAGTLNSSALFHYEGSSGKDQLAIDALGGDHNIPPRRSMEEGEPGGQALSGAITHLDLGKGADLINAIGYDLNGDAVAIDGGAGFDTIMMDGSFSNAFGAIRHVEKLVVSAAAGIFALTDSGVREFTFLNGTSFFTSLDGLQSGATINFVKSQSEIINVLVDGANTSTTDTLKVNLIAPTAQNASGSMVIGSFTNGLKAIGLSHLEIDSTSLGSTFENWLSLGSVGNAKNPLSITISGDHQLFLLSSYDAKSYIQHITVDNSAGVDLSGLTRGVQAFDPDGATIIGGVADDVLVGGDGNDLIRTGAGGNNVVSSTGADRIWLKANSGLDTLTFIDIDTSVAQDGIDAVHNFGAFDTIDISALVNSVLFEGNFDSFAEGEAALSTSVSSAFFNKASNTLYVDVDHDGTILSLHDLGVRLIGVSSIQSFNLLD